MTKVLTENRVNEILLDCLFDEEDNMTVDKATDENSVRAEGVGITFIFKKEKVEEHKAEIESMVQELHPTFKEGWTFLNMCYDKDNKLWTGFHQSMNELLCLGLAVGVMEYCSPKETWGMFPGGMPYIRVKQ